MRYDKRILDCPASVTDGSALRVADIREKLVTISGTFTGSIQIQGRVDGLDWINLGAPFTAAGFLKVDESVEEIRTHVTALSAGTPAARVSGRDARTDD